LSSGDEERRRQKKPKGLSDRRQKKLARQWAVNREVGDRRFKRSQEIRGPHDRLLRFLCIPQDSLTTLHI
jgi:hypothetical protein